MRNHLKVGSGLVLAGVALTGCVESGSGLFIVQAQVPEVVENTCKIPGTRTEVYLASGTLDVALDRPRPYRLYPLVTNVLPLVGEKTLDVEPNRLQMTGFEVRIDPPPGIRVTWPADAPPVFKWNAPLVILPDETHATIAEVISAKHAAAILKMFQEGKLPSDLREQVRFKVTIRAKARHGSSIITSDPFEFPIRVCYGCLQTGFTQPQFADFSFPKVPPCSKLASNPYLGNPCNPAQDYGPVLCCARDASGRDLECPAVPRLAPTVGMPTP